MRQVSVWCIIVVLFGVAASVATGQDLKTEEQKTFYALGLALSQNLAPFNLSEAELELVKSGLTDGMLNRPRKVDLPAYAPKLQELQQSRLAVAAASEKKAQSDLSRQSGQREGREQDPVGGDRHHRQARNRCVAHGDRQGQGSLHRHAD